MAISCVVEYPEDYCHERFYGITPAKRYVSMGYQGRSPWLVSDAEISYLKSQRIGTLATVGSNRRPHIVLRECSIPVESGVNCLRSRISLNIHLAGAFAHAVRSCGYGIEEKREIRRSLSSPLTSSSGRLRIAWMAECQM